MLWVVAVPCILAIALVGAGLAYVALGRGGDTGPSSGTTGATGGTGTGAPPGGDLPDLSDAQEQAADSAAQGDAPGAGGGTATWTPATPAHPGGFGLAVLLAKDRGCSTDRFTGADLRVTVTVGGAQVLQTKVAYDRDEAVFGAFVPLPFPTVATEVRVVAEEGEPGASTFVGCDIDPGVERAHAFNWTGLKHDLVLRGNASDSAEVHVLLGNNAPAAPSASGRAVEGANLAVRHDGGAGEHVLAWGMVGPEIGLASDRLTFIEGLCDGTDYTFRLLRAFGDWTVASDDFTLRTNNVAPEAPRILEVAPATTAGRIEVSWQEPTPHDVVRYELHATATPDEPLSATTQVAVHTPTARIVDQATEIPGGDGSATWIRIRAIDAGGLAAGSDAVQLGAISIAKETFRPCGTPRLA